MELSISKSLAHPHALLKKIGDCYGQDFIEGVLLQSRENDVYKITSYSNTYILKIYSVSASSNKFLGPKIDSINTLFSNQYGEDYVFRNRRGSFIQSLIYPEGERMAVLYRHFESIEKGRGEVSLFKYGIEIANFHELRTIGLENESSPLTDSEDIVLSVKLDNQTKFELFEFIEYIESYPQENLKYLEKGLCHGDCHLGNVIETKNGLRLIDFDYVNVNYVICDLVTMLWSHLYEMGANSEDIKSFFSGYSEVRTLPSATLDDVIYFLVRKEICYLLTYLSRQSTIGTIFVHDGLVAGRLKKLRNIIKAKKQIAIFKLLTQSC